MLTVHHLENSRSHRVVWLLEELGTDYEITKYERDPETMLAPPELRDVHPLGKSPVITDDGHTIAESGAILEYILDVYGDGELRPDPGTDTYLQYRYWMHYAEGSAMPMLVLKLVFRELPEQGPWLMGPLLRQISKMVSAEYINPQIDRHIDFWADELEGQQYFVGDEFTAADIQMSYPLAGALGDRGDPEEHGHLHALLDRLEERPAYNRALEETGDNSPFPGRS